MIKIARQGWRFVGASALAGAAGIELARRLPDWAALGWVLAAIGWGAAAFCAYFFRDPERPLPSDLSKIYSPGDGRVLSVAREGPGDVTTVRIFLSVFDVHIQRLPCSGKVERIQYVPGSFVDARLPGSKANERNVATIAVEGRRDRVVVEQIAGLIARRILCWIKEGDRAVAGERYGLIQFGSQAALHLPASARVLVSQGDRVAGGLTAVAEWTANG